MISIEWGKPWTKPVPAATVAVGLCTAVIVNYITAADPWVPLLDSANLAFHEAGHPFFATFGDTMGWLGGTLGQLTFPLAAAIVFWFRRHTYSFALAGVWLSQNLFNIARYMADARAQELPLVGGGEHDWGHLFSKWGVIQSDVVIAGWMRTFGWLGLASVMLWLAWRHWLEHRAAQAFAAAQAASQASRASAPAAPGSMPLMGPARARASLVAPHGGNPHHPAATAHVRPTHASPQHAVPSVTEPTAIAHGTASTAPAPRKPLTIPPIVGPSSRVR